MFLYHRHGRQLQQGSGQWFGHRGRRRARWPGLRDRDGQEVLEDSMLRTIHLKDLNLLRSKIEALKDLAFIAAVEVMNQLSDRLFSIQFQSAEERYKSIINNHPNILLRVPLGHIASYLGITQQTLSVIRAKI